MFVLKVTEGARRVENPGVFRDVSVESISEEDQVEIWRRKEEGWRCRESRRQKLRSTLGYPERSANWWSLRTRCQKGQKGSRGIASVNWRTKGGGGATGSRKLFRPT